MTRWTISRDRSKQPGLWHIQARTDDQLCSFALLAGPDAPISRTKGVDGKIDVFTCMSDQSHGTMNVVGQIKYDGEWPKS